MERVLEKLLEKHKKTLLTLQKIEERSYVFRQSLTTVISAIDSYRYDSYDSYHLQTA